VLQITPGERAALQSLAEGKSRGELAACLGIAEWELDSRLIALFRRMGVETEVEAAAEYVKRGLVDAGPNRHDLPRSQESG
jgi:DNA-binding CsgD family transcriptional regulator